MAELREIVRDTLRESGLSVLDDPDRFSKLVLADIDPRSRDAAVIRAACQRGFLAPFAEAGRKADKAALSAASTAAAAYLDAEHAINPADAKRVSSSVAAGLGMFLGVDGETGCNRDSVGEAASSPAASKGRRLLKTVAISSLVFLVLSAAGLAVASHFYPIFGCTLFPRTANVASIKCRWYIAKDREGSPHTIIFLDNPTPDTQYVTAEGGLFHLHPNIALGSGDEGIALLAGAREMRDLAVTSEKPATSTVESASYGSLEWVAMMEKGEQGAIRIRNNGQSAVPLKTDGVIVSTKGLKASAMASFIVDENKMLRPGDNDFFISSMKKRWPIGDDISIDDDIEVYVNGVKIKRAE